MPSPSSTTGAPERSASAGIGASSSLSASASASTSAPAHASSEDPEHRFTLSDYYSFENDPRRTPSPSGGLVQSRQQQQAQQNKQHTRNLTQTETLITGTPGPSSSNTITSTPTIASSSRNSRSKLHTLPTIITTSSPTVSSPSRSDLFEVPETPRRLSSSSSASRPSNDPLGVMSHPLGPGPQPYPASPDGNHSDTEEYIPTYPPRGYYANSPSTPTRSHPMMSPASARDLQRELQMGERALGTGPSQISASTAYAQLRPMAPVHNPSSPGGVGFTQRQNPMMSPTASSRRPSQALSDSSFGLGRPALSRATTSPFDDEKLSMGKVIEVPAASSSRALGTHGPARTTTTNVMQDWFPKSWPCRFLMLAVFLEAAINIAIQANILWRFHMEYGSVDIKYDAEYDMEKRKTLSRLPVYLYIFVTAHIVQLGLTFWSIRTRNTIQVIGLAIFNCMFLIYSGIEMKEIRDISVDLDSAVAEETNRLLAVPIQVLSIVSISVVAVSVAAVSILSWYIWREFGWDIYRSLGADLRIRRYYFQYQVFECIVCFSFFFFVGFGVQFALTVLEKNEAEYYITWVMVPVLVFWLTMGLVSARFEWAYVMATFLVGLLGGTAYFIFKLVRIWTQPAIYNIVAKSLTVFSVLSLFMIILTFVYGALVWRNFNNGLRQSLDARRKERTAERHAMRATGTSDTSAYKVHRLTID